MYWAVPNGDSSKDLCTRGVEQLDVRFVTRSRRGRASLGRAGLLILIVVLLAVPAASSGKTVTPSIPTRLVGEPHKDVFESWGTDCASKVTHTRLWFDPGTIEKRRDVHYSGAGCEVSAGPVKTTRVPLPSVTIPASISGPGKWCPNLGGGADWIHTSWTFQINFINTDSLWLRSSFFRLWSCHSTWWSDYPGDVYAWSGHGGTIGNTNNTPTWPFIDWYCSRQSFDCYQTLAETKAKFNVKESITYNPGANYYGCDVTEQINVYSYEDGSWFVDFWTSFGPHTEGCSAYHSSTGARTSDYESSGYGGKTDKSTKMSIAVPYVSGK